MSERPDDLVPDDDMLAAEYALGLLVQDDREAARARLARDQAFAARVTAWQMQLSEMADLAPVQPPAGLRARLMDRVFPRPARVPFWQRLGVWRGLTGAAVAVALGLAVVAFGPETAPVPQHLYSAEIASSAGDFRVVALVDKATNEVTLTRTLGAAPEGRILQVWAHGPDKPAQSVGLWPAGESIRLPLPPEIAAVKGVLTLGVSEEPPGGSLTGRPSGRVFGTVDIPGVTSTL